MAPICSRLPERSPSRAFSHGTLVKCISIYANFILSKNVSGHAAESCIRHAQQFAYGLDGIKLRDVDKAYLTNYFDELGRCDNIVAWQFRQAVSAIEMLFEMLAVNPVAKAFNWDECREAARELGQEHPTVARTVPSAETVARRVEKDAVLNDPEVLRALGRLRDVTRVRNLAIRTEQTYSTPVPAERSPAEGQCSRMPPSHRQTIVPESAATIAPRSPPAPRPPPKSPATRRSPPDTTVFRPAHVC